MTSTDAYVWHFVLARTGQPVERGERLATLSLPPDAVAALGGLAKLRKVIDAERLVWARRVIEAGYVDGYGVSVVAERGFRRSIFPAAAVAGLTPSAPALVAPGSAVLRSGPIALPGGRPDA